MNYHTMSYLAAVAALTGNLPAYDVPIYRDAPTMRHTIVVVEPRREAPIETAYSSMMRHYYDSVWETRRPVAPLIIER
jgi:hypothetical protein